MHGHTASKFIKQLVLKENKNTGDIFQRQFVALGGEIKDGFFAKKIQPGEKVKISGSCNGEDVTLTASKVAICLGPWTKKFIDPLLSKKGLMSQCFAYRKKN
jgi:hypothetical protein